MGRGWWSDSTYSSHHSLGVPTPTAPRGHRAGRDTCGHSNIRLTARRGSGRHVTKLGGSTRKILFSPRTFGQADTQPPAGSRAMEDQQSPRRDPGGAVTGRGLGSCHDLQLGMRICVPHLPDLTQEQAAD